MGQKLGKCDLCSPAHPFSNLPKRSITHIWQVFNSIADGFGICREELEEMCADLKFELNISRLATVENAAALFLVLDTDKNGLIDALEFASTIAAISGMRFIEIMHFILTCYDFNGMGELTMDEVTLALKSVAIGLSKLSNVKVPRDDVIEHLVSTLYRDIAGSGVHSINIPIIAENLIAHPDIKSWYAYYCDPEPTGMKKYNILPSEMSYKKENPHFLRSDNEQEAIEWTAHMDQKFPYVSTMKDKVKDHSWLDRVEPLMPTKYEKKVPPPKQPDVSLVMNWVYGYEAERTKSTIKYLKSGEILYTAGPYCIIYDMKKHKQRFFTGHTELVLCLSLDRTGRYVATGESGKQPRVIIWEGKTRNVLFSDRNFHRDGVIQTAFSADGNLLASVGNDLHHSVALWDWKSGTLLHSSHVDQGKCLSCCFANDDVFVVGGDSYVYFWTKSSEGYTRRRGNFSRHSSLQPITSLVAIFGTIDSLVSGTISGQLFLWTDRNCVRVVKAHDGAVTSVFSNEHGIVTGGVDKRIRMWTNELEPGATFDVTYFGFLPELRSVCMSSDGNTIVFGTLGASIFEISTVDGSDLRGGSIVTCHYRDKLTSLATNPSKYEMATVGEDKHLRVWDLKTKSLLKIATFDGRATCVTYGPLGDVIAIGLGADKNVTGKSGAYVVINEEDLSIIHEGRDSQVPITLVQFSADGETLAVGAEDGSIFLYAAMDAYELIGRCTRQQHPIRHVDFTVDGEWLRSNSDGNDLCFFNADDASFQSNLASMRDVRWATVTCKYSWHTQQIHRTAYDGETILKVHAASPGSKFIAAGSSYGYVRLLSFPCVHPQAESRRLLAHYGEISGLMFTYDGKTLLTAGKTDRCMVQYDVKVFKEDKVAVMALGYDSDDLKMESRPFGIVKDDFMKEHAFLPSGILNKDAGGNFVVEDETRELQMNMWKEQVTQPLYPPGLNPYVPDVSLRLEFAAGFRCHGMRSNIRYTDDNKVLFVVASMVVKMNKETREQEFYRMHDDAITAFAVNYDGTIGASGQQGQKPCVSVWSTKTLETLWVSPDMQKGHITCITFGSGGVDDCNLLAIAGNDADHTISVYDWRRNHLATRAYGGSGHVISLAFSPDDKELLAVGQQTIRFYDITTRAMTVKRPFIGDKGKLQFFLSCAYFADRALVGTQQGDIYVFKDNELEKSMIAHGGPVNVMHVSKMGNVMVTGGGRGDGAVRTWNQKLDCVKEVTVRDIVQSAVSPVVIKGCALANDEGTVVVGTRGAELLEIEIRSGTLFGKGVLLEGHGKRELHGLATHPKKDQFVTVGDDNTMRVWSSATNSQTRLVNLGGPARCVAFSPDGSLVAVGLGMARKRILGNTDNPSSNHITSPKGKGGAVDKDNADDSGKGKMGTYMVFDTTTYKKVHEAKDSNEPIRAVRFSPDGRLLAVGSEDTKIIIYNVKDNFKNRANIMSHRAPIVNIDFSTDGMFIMSNDSTRRTIYTETTAGLNVPSAASLRDEKWATYHSTVGWSMQGLWKCQPPWVDLQCSQRSWNSILTCTGNSDGRLFVTHYPAQDRVPFVDVCAHAGPVSRVAWGAGDAYMVSTGQVDHAVLKWRVVYDDGRESGTEGGLSCEDSGVERDGGHEYKDGEMVLNTKLAAGQIQQWISNIAPPSTVKAEVDDSKPDINPILEYAHGARVADCRQSVLYNADGNLVYISGSNGVIYERSENKQIIYIDHKNSVVSIAVDPTGMVAATGEMADYAAIHIWNARTAVPMTQLNNVHRNAVTAISFSASGHYLVSIGQDKSSSIVVLHSPSAAWNDAYVSASVAVSANKCLWALYEEVNDFPLVVGGDKCLYFFKPLGKTLERAKGVFGRRNKVQPMMMGVAGERTKAGSGEKSIYTVAVTGHIFVWMAKRIITSISAHNAPIYAIIKLHGKYGFATGGKDGLIKLWSNDFQLMHTYNVRSFEPEPYYLNCHSLRTNIASNKLVVALRGGEIYEISVATHSYINLFESHSYRELHGIALNPQNTDQYCTTGDDGLIRVWSLKDHKVLKRGPLDSACRAVAWRPDGKHIACGIGGDPENATRDGTIMILEAESLDTLFEDRKAKKWITDVKYTVDGKMLGIASMDGMVYIYDSDKFNILKSVEPAKGNPIIRLDFNIEGTHLRVGSTERELYTYTIADMVPSGTPSAVRDVHWATHGVPYAWNVKGAWRPLNHAALVTSVDVNETRNLLCSAYQNGDVWLSRYPFCNFGGDFIRLPGVSSQVRRLLFTKDGKYLLILDAYSRSILQFRLDEVEQMSEYRKAMGIEE